MTKKEYLALLDDGYYISHYSAYSDMIFEEDYELIEYDEKEFKDIILLKAVPKATKPLKFVKIKKSIVFTLDDLMTFLLNAKTAFSYFTKDLVKWMLDEDDYIGRHIKFESIGKIPASDYFYRSKNHYQLITDILFKISEADPKPESFKDTIDKIIDMLQLLLNNNDENNYDDDTLAFIINHIDKLAQHNKKIPKKIIDYYKEKLLYLVDKGNNDAIALYAFNLYEGNFAFDIDYFKSRDLFELYYAKTQDPFIANVLGYIYYYGRCNNGIIEADKAFKYFLIGHLDGGIYESTYKLSDCFIHGYGTFVNYKIASHLLYHISKECRDRFLSGNINAKFPDVELRIGNLFYYGQYEEQDYYGALLHYLPARAALKYRLLYSQYIGDRTVAKKLFEHIKIAYSFNEGKEERVPNIDAYIIDVIQGYPLRYYEFIDGNLHLYLAQEKLTLVSIPELDFSEVATEIHLMYTNVFQTPELTDFLDSNIGEDVIISLGNIILCTVDRNKIDNHQIYFDCDQLLFFPVTIKDPAKKYQLLTIQNINKNYKEYILYDEGKDDLKINDVIKYHDQDFLITNIDYLYEDELPYPLEMMDYYEN